MKCKNCKQNVGAKRKGALWKSLLTYIIVWWALNLFTSSLAVQTIGGIAVAALVWFKTPVRCPICKGTNIEVPKRK